MYVVKAIRPSDGDVKPCGSLGTFREEQAVSRHRVSPSPFHHHRPTQHNYTTQTVTHTVTLTSTSNIVHYTDTRPTRNVVCPSGAWLKNRPHSSPFVRLAWNPKRVIVQWVGIGTHTHFVRHLLIWKKKWTFIITKKSCTANAPFYMRIPCLFPHLFLNNNWLPLETLKAFYYYCCYFLLYCTTSWSGLIFSKIIWRNCLALV